MNPKSNQNSPRTYYLLDRLTDRFPTRSPNFKILSFAQETQPQREKGISINFQNSPGILNAVDAQAMD